MNSRDTILQNVRNNQPGSLELPSIPRFQSGQTVDRKARFVAALKELDGEVVQSVSFASAGFVGWALPKGGGLLRQSERPKTWQVFRAERPSDGPPQNLS